MTYAKVRQEIKRSSTIPIGTKCNKSYEIGKYYSNVIESSFLST